MIVCLVGLWDAGKSQSLSKEATKIIFNCNYDQSASTQQTIDGGQNWGILWESHIGGTQYGHGCIQNMLITNAKNKSDAELSRIDG